MFCILKHLFIVLKHLLVPYASYPGRYKSEPGLSIKILGVADECTDDPRCNNDIAGIGFGQFFNPPQGSGMAAPPTSADDSMQACALWPQAAIDGLDDAMRELEPTIPPGGTPAQTLCPTTCKSKHCVGKHG